MNKIIRYLAFLLLSFTVMSCDSSDEMKDITISPKEEVKPQVVKVFSHPGILFTYEDMARIKEQAFYYAKPWKLSYEMLKGHANVNYVVQGPYAEVERTEGVNSPAAGAMSSDSQMAYHCALMWVITGEQQKQKYNLH